MAGERVAKSKTWPDSPRALAGRLRRAATFLRKIGIEIGFEREGRARTRIIRISTTASHRRARKWRGATVRTVRTVRVHAEIQSRQRLRGARLCGRSPTMRTVRAARQRSTVRANPLKTNGGTAADGADANLPPQSAPEKAGAGLEGAAMSAAEALKAARAAGVRTPDRRRRPDAGSRRPAAARVLDLLARHKAEIVALLRRAGRLVGRGLAGLLRRTSRHRRVRRRAAARGGRGPRLRLLRRRMAEPQLRALAAGPLPWLRRARARP